MRMIRGKSPLVLTMGPFCLVHTRFGRPCHVGVLFLARIEIYHWQSDARRAQAFQTLKGFKFGRDIAWVVPVAPREIESSKDGVSHLLQYSTL